MTPEQLRILFDGWWVVGSIALGVAVKYLPLLKRISNQSIGWLNVTVYVLTHVASALVGTASAQGDTTQALAVGAPGAVAAIPGVLSVLIGSLTTAAWARTLYEALGRPLLERLLKLKKA